MSTKLALETTTPDTATFTVTASGKGTVGGVVVCRSFSGDDGESLAAVLSEPVTWEDEKTGAATVRRIEGCVKFDAYCVEDQANVAYSQAVSNVVEF